MTADANRESAVGESKRKKVALRSIGALSLDEHVDDLRARVASEFRRRGDSRHRLEAVTDEGEVFEVDIGWRDNVEQEIVRRTLPDVCRRRGVKRYLIALEAWASFAKGVRPSEDPDRTEWMHVVGTERGGERRSFRAEIKRRPGEDAALGDWVSEDIGGWMFELLDADADEQPRAGHAVPVLDDEAVQSLVDADPDCRDQIRICMELDAKIKEELQRLYRPGENWAVFSALCAIIVELLPRGFWAGLKQNAQVLRDRPDIFPITPSVKPMDKADVMPCINKHWRRYRDPIAEILEGQPDEAVFNAVVNIAMHGGATLMGGPVLADYLESLLKEEEAAA